MKENKNQGYKESVKYTVDSLEKFAVKLTNKDSIIFKERFDFQSRYAIGEVVMFTPKEGVRLPALIDTVIFMPAKIRYNLLLLDDLATVEGIYSQRVADLTKDEINSISLEEVVIARKMVIKYTG